MTKAGWKRHENQTLEALGNTPTRWLLESRAGADLLDLIRRSEQEPSGALAEWKRLVLVSGKTLNAGGWMVSKDGGTVYR